MTKDYTSIPTDGAHITPDDATDLDTTCRAINVSTAGFVKVTTTSGADLTLYVAAGFPFSIAARRIWATGTDAAGIVALW